MSKIILHPQSVMDRSRSASAPAVRLFCFPYAGGGAAMYRTWISAFSTVEVCPVELPGRGARFSEAPVGRLDQLVPSLARDLEPYLHAPFAFFGHSMGALISFELERYLRARGHRGPVHLFVSGCSAPHFPRRQRTIGNLPPTQFIEKLRHLNGTPREVLENAELMELLLPMLRADFSLVETYEYHTQSPLACQITAFGGLDDPDAPFQRIDAWREHTAANFRSHMLAGDHFFLRAHQYTLLQLIGNTLGSSLCP